MTSLHLTALLPWIAMAGLGLVLLLVIAFVRRETAGFWTSLVGLAAVAGTFPVAFTSIRTAPVHVGELLVVDRFALLYCGLILAATTAVVLLGHGYWRRMLARSPGETPAEVYPLLAISTLGAMVLAAATHLATLFLGLETLSVALYVLIGYLRRERRSVEAALKYLILAGASSAFLLFGIALVYAELGTMALGVLASGGAAGSLGAPVALAGLALILVGVGFKLAVVPFHLWTPDVYQGAPAPVTAFVATVSKGAVLAVLARWALTAGDAWAGPLVVVLGALAALSMVAGNLLALLQEDVQRLLAYSSIAHLGYALVALLAGIAARSGGGSGPGAEWTGAEALTFYLAAYFLSILGAFGTVAALSPRGGPVGEPGAEVAETGALADYRGLFWRRPWLAALLTACLLSLAGIPLTGGFVGKFFALAAGVEGAFWGLVLILVATSAVGLFYYLRVVVTMLSPRPEIDGALPAAGWAAGLALAAAAVGLLWLGAWPAPAMELIRGAVAGVL